MGRGRLVVSFAAACALTVACSGAGGEPLPEQGRSADDVGSGGGSGGGGGAHTAPEGPVEDCPADLAPEPGRVITDRGAVRGSLEGAEHPYRDPPSLESGAVWAFRGVPFAAPPTGQRRFAAPRPAACWEGERAAEAFGPACLQRSDAGGATGSEDCLTLNVFAPSDYPDRAAGSAEAAPVFVFVHGGGHQQGSSGQSTAGVRIYDGVRFVRQAALDGRPAVLVSVNYRLGPFGYLALEALRSTSDDGATGNYGLADQAYALAWVQRNIGAFGGDPARVTVFGESAGAVSTCALATSPLSRGLMQRGLMQSGACVANDLADAEARGEELATALGCSVADAIGGGGEPRAAQLECLRAADGSAFIDQVEPIDLLAPSLGWGPVIDGVALPQAPLAAIEAGEWADVPFVIGTNTEETGASVPATLSEASYEALVRAYAGGISVVADQILAAYPVADSGPSRQRWSDFDHLQRGLAAYDAA